MRFERLILKNFLTYEELDYEFVKYPLQVQGENLTDDNQKTNGSGKSGLLTAIEYAVTGMNSRGVRDTELINYDHDSAEIELFTLCPVRGETLHIHVILNKKGSNKLFIKSKKGEEWEDIAFSSASEGRDIITNWFLISREDLFNYYFINKKRFKSFFKSSNEEKISLINRFSDASIIDGLDKSLDEDIKKIDASIEKTNEAIGTIQTKIVENDATIVEKKNSLEYENKRDLSKEQEATLKEIDESILSKKEDIKSKEKEIIEIEKSDEELSIQLEALNISFKEAKTKIDTLTLENFIEQREVVVETIKKKKEGLTKFEKEVKDKNKSVEKASKIISTLNNQLAGIITCPKCSHKFSLEDEELDYEETVTKKEKAEKIKKLLSASIESIEKSKKEIEEKIDKMIGERDELGDKDEAQTKLTNKLKKEVEELNEKVTKKLGEISSNKEKVKQLNSTIDLFKKTIENLIKEKEQTKKPNNKKRIEELNEEIKEVEKNTKELNKEILLHNVDIEKEEVKKSNLIEWQNDFKRFRMHVANQSLNVMQYHCNDYLDQMGSDLRVKFSGFRVLADKSIKEEITALVVRNFERTFDSYSGGEQGRLLFASILANKFMIDSSHPYGGLDFIGVDEIFEGVDSLGLKHIMESIKDMNSTIMLITHVSDEEIDSNTIKVVKINGKSELIYE